MLSKLMIMSLVRSWKLFSMLVGIDKLPVTPCTMAAIVGRRPFFGYFLPAMKFCRLIASLCLFFFSFISRLVFIPRNLA